MERNYIIKRWEAILLVLLSIALVTIIAQCTIAYKTQRTAEREIKIQKLKTK